MPKERESWTGTDAVCFLAEVVIVMLAVGRLPSPEAWFGLMAILPEAYRRTVKNL